MLKHTQGTLFLNTEDIDKVFWKKIKSEKRIYNRNKKNGHLVDERTGKRNEY